MSFEEKRIVEFEKKHDDFVYKSKRNPFSKY